MVVMQKKEVLVFLDSQKENMEILEALRRLFPNFVFLDVYLRSANETFVKGGKEYQNLDFLLFSSPYLVNLHSKKHPFGKKLFKKKDFLKLKTFQNSFFTDSVFSSKANVKKILKKKGIKTAIFESLENKTAQDLFYNFPQPSRIFSKDNLFYTGKIQSLSELEENFSLVNHSLKDFFTEEYIFGDDIYSLIFKFDGKIFSFSGKADPLEKADLLFIQESLREKLERQNQEYFKALGIDNFALFHYRYNSKRGLYLSNVFTTLDILRKNKIKIFENILSLYGINPKMVFLQETYV